jgi:predicted acetyltransferase
MLSIRVTGTVIPLFYVTLVGRIPTRHTLTMGVLLKFGFHRGHQVWPSIRNKQLGLREILFLIKQTIERTWGDIYGTGVFLKIVL